MPFSLTENIPFLALPVALITLKVCWLLWLVPTSGSRYFSRSANGRISLSARAQTWPAALIHAIHLISGDLSAQGKAKRQHSRCCARLVSATGWKICFVFSNNTCCVLCGGPGLGSSSTSASLPTLPPPLPAPPAAADHVRCAPPPGFPAPRRPRRRLLHVLRRELGEVLVIRFSRTWFAGQPPSPANYGVCPRTRLWRIVS